MIPTGSRRSKIRPPRRLNAPTDSGTKAQFDYPASWQVLANAIAHIQNKNVSSLSYEQLYRVAYTIVLQKCAHILYDDVQAAVGAHLEKRRSRVLAILDSSYPDRHEAFLRAMCEEWAEHLQLMKFVSDVLMYLNRAYVKDGKKLLIYDMGIALFDTHFLRFGAMEVARGLVQILNDEIAKLRSAALATKLYVVKMVAMLEVVSEDRSALAKKDALQTRPPIKAASLYHDQFEKELLHRSELYFTSAAEDALAAALGTRYLHDIHSIIQEEEARLDSLVGPGSGAGTLLRTETRPKIILLMDSILIRGHLEHVMVYPAEMQGLLYWLEPVVAQALRGASDAAARDHTAELRLLFALEGRIDPERKRLKTRLRDVLVAQGAQIPGAVLRHLDLQTAPAAANGAKKAPVSYASAAFVVAWIDAVLQYQKQLVALVQDAFQADPSVEFTVLASVRQFINQPGGRRKKSDAPALDAAELLAIYVDHHIKQFAKPGAAKRAPAGDGAGIDETDAFLQKVVAFLKIVEDKYGFEGHYAALFAKRFLNLKGSFTALSAGSGGDIEELVLAKLWEEVFSDSHHLERIVKMRRDVTLSAEITSEWRRHVTTHLLGVAELELKICNVAEWPKALTRDLLEVSGDSSIIWPTQLRATMGSFEEFWRTGRRNDNKALCWYPKFGQMDLRITYPTKTYDINLSTYGGVIMMLFAPQSTDADGDPVLAFDEQRVLTYREIAELTRIPEFDLKRQLKSIAVAPRLRLLVKLPMLKDIEETDTFMLNSKFKAPSTKVKVLTVKSDAPKAAESKPEADEVQAGIDEGRKHLISAAIVRTMKSRQTLKHNALVEEIIKQLQHRFLPPMVHIKQRIEELIEKEYLRRDADTPNVYHYIA